MSLDPTVLSRIVFDAVSAALRDETIARGFAQAIGPFLSQPEVSRKRGRPSMTTADQAVDPVYDAVIAAGKQLTSTFMDSTTV